MSAGYLLAVDQGTSSSRAVIFDPGLLPVASAQEEFPQSYPQPGWVEHDPESIWQSVQSVMRRALAEAGLSGSDIVAIGITNQRETTMIWDRNTGRCIHNAIVWQDRRTASFCKRLQEQGATAVIASKTGLRPDPYFSATKIGWLLDNVEGARDRAESGDLAFGTVDTYLLWKLTGGRVHATDASNASRTMLFNIHEQTWDEDLLELFGVPRRLLPDVKDSAYNFGEIDASLLGAAVPVAGMAGDQQAALIGQAGLAAGITKCTFGTGCFAIANTGGQALQSRNHLLTTVASRLSGQVTYGLEGSVFVAGSAIQWLRDELRVIATAPESEQVAERTGVVEDVYVVPAFAGLGAPYWDPHARGAVLGLSRGSGRDQIVTATLQAVAYQSHDLVQAMADDGVVPSSIRVDGGMANNNWFLQFLADVLDIPVERPHNVESTVLGAASLAAIQCGLIGSLDEIASLWRRDGLFEPSMTADRRTGLLNGWQQAVARVKCDV